MNSCHEKGVRSSWNQSCRSRALRGIGIVKRRRKKRDRQLRFQLDS
eukprot:gene3843-biopygen12258